MSYADKERRRAWHQAYRKAHLDVHREESRRRYWKNRERILKECKLRYQANRKKVSDKNRLKQYGMTPEEYEQILCSQGGVCAICKGSQLGNRCMAVDHDHETGKVRGLLCDSCNNGLGRFRDDITLLRAAVAYLSEE